MVTGVGAIIGYGVLRSLRNGLPDIRLIGADIYSDAVGQAWCDRFATAPLTADPGYSSWLRQQVSDHEVDLLVPAIEQDVDYLSDNRTELQDLGCRVMLNTATLIGLARDKWAMDRELLSIGEPSRIPSLDHGSFRDLKAEFGLPFLLKPRRGYASKGIVEVHDEVTFERHAPELGDRLFAQQIVGSDSQEFTVSIFGDGTGASVAMSCLHRKLAADGSTAKATCRLPGDLPGLEDVITRLAAHFRPEGPTNLQFRHVDTEWKLLEINPRISSSTSIRTAFGYNESAMSVGYYLDGIRPTQPHIRTGHAARYIEDMIVLDRDSV